MLFPSPCNLSVVYLSIISRRFYDYNNVMWFIEIALFFVFVIPSQSRELIWFSRNQDHDTIEKRGDTT